MSTSVGRINIAPRAGAWIEIISGDYFTIYVSSHLVQVRGLKSELLHRTKPDKTIAPRAGAWIEIFLVAVGCEKVYIAPRAGAWIEI